MRGRRLVIGGPPFSLKTYRKALHDHAVTFSSLTPVLVRAILSADPSVLAPLRVLTIGGDALEPALVLQTLTARSGGELYLTYGLTQAGPRVSTLGAHREPSSRHSSVGLPLAGTRVSLVPVDDGELRQLHVTSDTVMKRTIGRVEGRSAHDGLTVGTSSRTIATGDAFYQDDDGYLYFRGRLGDFISRRGEKINLAAVRRVALQIAGVVNVRTPVVRVEGSEDFDLELGVDNATGEFTADVRGQLRRMLGQSEMPREIHVQAATVRAELHYK
jgi:acyl-coenzyme A synthetase/AMP-(fatty) acid ligase